MIKEQIISALKKALEEMGLKDVEPVLEHPSDEKHGDYSSNIAMVVFKKYQVSSSKYKVLKTPLDLAKEIAKILNTKYLIPNTCDRIEAVAPGFINFWLSKDYLIHQLASQVASQGETLEAKRGRGKVMVEFTDPNPFKEFHIGHLYSNIVGESLCRLLEANGARVMRANYQGDVGMHVAKALYGLQQLATSNKQLEDLSKKPLSERVKILGEAYALGAKAYEEDEEAKREINELNKKVYEKDPGIMNLYEKGRQWSLDYFESIYQRLGTKFDFYYFESEVGKIGLELVKEYLGKGVFEESEGAVIFPGKQFGLHTRVFINSLGLPTYEAKELGLAPTKYEDFPYDQSIIVTGNEIIEYFKVLLAALAKIRPDLAAKTKHIPHGMVRLAQGKMSSRTGNIITGEWLLDEAKAKIKEKFTDIGQQVAEQVAVGAVKYALLKSSIGKDIAFSFEESISLEGNSGPYIQYTFARTQSVLAKARTTNYKQLTPNPSTTLSTSSLRAGKLEVSSQQLEVNEVILLRLLHRFPEIVSEASQGFAPNIVCEYLFNLAQNFNLFYQKHSILNPGGDPSTRPSTGSGLAQDDIRHFRLSLTSAVGQTLKTGLYLLGIQSPEKM